MRAGPPLSYSEWMERKSHKWQLIARESWSGRNTTICNHEKPSRVRGRAFDENRCRSNSKTMNYAVVTGAASGIGKAATETLWKVGYNIVAVDIQEMSVPAHPTFPTLPKWQSIQTDLAGRLSRRL